MTITLQALLGFIAWTLFLLVVMEVIRSWLVLSGAVPQPREHQPLALHAAPGQGACQLP